MHRILLLTLCLPPAAPAAASTWDGGSAGVEAALPEVPVRSSADPELAAAVEAFLTELLVEGDVDAAAARVTTLIDDPCLGMPPMDETCRGGRPSLLLADRAARWLAVLRKRNNQWVVKRSLPALFMRLAPEAGYAALVSGQAGDARVERLGSYCLVLRPARPQDLDGFNIGENDGRSKLFFKYAARSGVELRVVIAGSEPAHPWDVTRRFDTMLWAREEGGWKLWGLGETTHTERREP